MGIKGSRKGAMGKRKEKQEKMLTRSYSTLTLPMTVLKIVLKSTYKPTSHKK